MIMSLSKKALQRVHRLCDGDRLSEWIVILVVCVSPWAYGAVEAWAELGLYFGIVLLTILGLRRPIGSDHRRRLVRLPGIALGGLVLFAILQTIPFDPAFLGKMAPGSSASMTQLLPDQPEHLLGDHEFSVRLPAATLSVEPDSTMQVAAKLAAAWLLFRAILGMRETREIAVRIARAVVLNSALLAFFAIIQRLTWNGCIYWVRPAHGSAASWLAGGPFLNHSHLAAYLNMGLGLALGLILNGKRRDGRNRDRTRPWTIYATVMIIAGVIGSHSRSGFLGLVAASVLVVCCLGGRLNSLGWAAVLGLAVIGVSYTLVDEPSSVGLRLATILDLRDEGYSNRMEIWRAAVHAWWVRPLWGSGLGVFPVAITPYLQQSRQFFFARAENEYVEMLVEGGVIGLTISVAFIVAIAGLAYRALRNGPGANDQGLVVGAVFGLAALSVQSFADFALHIPAVAVFAVVLCGLITRYGRAAIIAESGDVDLRNAGLDGVYHSSSRLENQIDCGIFLNRRPSTREQWPTWIFRPRLTPWLKTKTHLLGLIVVSILLLAHAVRDTWIEHRLDRVGLAAPGNFLPTVGTLETMTWGLDECRLTLQDVLRHRPDWAEGYLRLGLIHLGLYREMTKQWLDDAGVDPQQIDQMAEPLWLLGAVHNPNEKSNDPSVKIDFMSFEPVSIHLVAALRCFLQARRCSPLLALPHAEIAALDYLLDKGDWSSIHGRRALLQSGNDAPLLAYVAQLAVQIDDPALAASCWRKSLRINPVGWTDIADAARIALSPMEILTEVTSDGLDAVHFAERLYQQDSERPIRDRFLQAAIERFGNNRTTTITAEQIFVEGHALACLDQSPRASERMERALTMEPAQTAWREEYIDWLLRWGRVDEAHAHALYGYYVSPESNAIRQAVDRTTNVLALGASPP